MTTLRLLKIWADKGYRGEFITLVKEQWDIELEIVQREEQQAGFVVEAALGGRANLRMAWQVSAFEQGL